MPTARTHAPRSVQTRLNRPRLWGRRGSGRMGGRRMSRRRRTPPPSLNRRDLRRRRLRVAPQREDRGRRAPSPRRRRRAKARGARGMRVGRGGFDTVSPRPMCYARCLSLLRLSVAGILGPCSDTACARSDTLHGARRPPSAGCGIYTLLRAAASSRVTTAPCPSKKTSGSRGFCTQALGDPPAHHRPGLVRSKAG